MDAASCGTHPTKAQSVMTLAEAVGAEAVGAEAADWPASRRIAATMPAGWSKL